MNFIENLDRILKEKNETKTSLARAIGVGESTIRGWYSGKIPTVDKVIHISQYWAIDINKLLGIENESEIEKIYNKLEPKDKDIVDNIFSRYKEQEQKSSTTMIS